MYDDVSSISTELRILPDRLFIQINTDSNTARRQTASIQYSVVAPVIYTANVMNNTLVENVTSDVRNINFSTDTDETIEFNAVGMLNFNMIKYL